MLFGWTIWLWITNIFTAPMTLSPWDQYHASRNNNNIVITSRNTSTNLVVLLCRSLALTSCLFPFSTLSVVSNASSYNRSVRDACDVSCVISSFCRAEISSNAFSVPLTSLAKSETVLRVYTLSGPLFFQILPTWNCFPVLRPVIAVPIMSTQTGVLPQSLCSVLLTELRYLV